MLGKIAEICDYEISSFKSVYKTFIKDAKKILLPMLLFSIASGVLFNYLYYSHNSYLFKSVLADTKLLYINTVFVTIDSFLTLLLGIYGAGIMYAVYPLTRAVIKLSFVFQYRSNPELNIVKKRFFRLKKNNTLKYLRVISLAVFVYVGFFLIFNINHYLDAVAQHASDLVYLFIIVLMIFYFIESFHEYTVYEKINDDNKHRYARYLFDKHIYFESLNSFLGFTIFLGVFFHWLLPLWYGAVDLYLQSSFIMKAKIFFSMMPLNTENILDEHKVINVFLYKFDVMALLKDITISDHTDFKSALLKLPAFAVLGLAVRKVAMYSLIIKKITMVKAFFAAILAALLQVLFTVAIQEIYMIDTKSFDFITMAFFFSYFITNLFQTEDQDFLKKS